MSAITDKILADMELSKGFDRKREEQMLKETSDFMGEIIDTKGELTEVEKDIVRGRRFGGKNDKKQIAELYAELGRVKNIDVNGSAEFDMPNPLFSPHLSPRDHHYLSTKCAYPVRKENS